MKWVKSWLSLLELCLKRFFLSFFLLLKVCQYSIVKNTSSSPNTTAEKMNKLGDKKVSEIVSENIQNWPRKLPPKLSPKIDLEIEHQIDPEIVHQIAPEILP